MMPPHSKEIEQAVLGALMISPDALYGAFDKLFPGFAHDSHGVESEDGKYFVYVLDKSKQGKKK